MHSKILATLLQPALQGTCNIKAKADFGSMLKARTVLLGKILTEDGKRGRNALIYQIKVISTTDLGGFIPLLFIRHWG